jgi:peptidylprolyl isomerase
VKKAETGDTVKVHYTGKLDSGEVFDSSEGKTPLEFKIGEGRLIKDFENSVIGLAEGESKQIKIPSEKAYGEKKENLIGKLPKDKLPPNIEPKEGLRLQMKTPEDQTILMTIIDVSDTDITVDANHELAGENLNFDVKMVEIK